MVNKNKEKDYKKQIAELKDMVISLKRRVADLEEEVGIDNFSFSSKSLKRRLNDLEDEVEMSHSDD
jgi:cell division protein FtsB